MTIVKYNNDIIKPRIWITFYLTYRVPTFINLTYKATYDMPAKTLQYFSRLDTTTCTCSALRRERLWFKYKCLRTSQIKDVGLIQWRLSNVISFQGTHLLDHRDVFHVYSLVFSLIAYFRTHSVIFINRLKKRTFHHIRYGFVS